MTATVLSSTEIQANWNEVPEIDQNGIIRNYTVNFNAIELVSGQGSRRKRAAENTLEACVVGGESMINRSDVIPENRTSAMLMNLSKSGEITFSFVTTPPLCSSPQLPMLCMN